MQPETTRLLIVDDHVLLLEALVALFAPAKGFSVVATTTAADEAVQLTGDLKPCVVLLDAQMPGQAAFEAARTILRYHKLQRLVFLDDYINAMRISEALRLGAMGYFIRNRSFQQLFEGVRTVSRGIRAFDPDISGRLEATPQGLQLKYAGNQPSLGSLTRREMEVMRYLAQGYSVKQCAERMGLAHSTVDNHKSRLMKKLNLHKVTALTRLAIREGLIQV